MPVVKGLRIAIGDEGVLEKTPDRKQAAAKQSVMKSFWIRIWASMGP